MIKLLNIKSMEKSGDGGLFSTLLAFFASILIDHWVEAFTLILSAVGLFWAVRNYRANIKARNFEAEVQRLEAHKLALEIFVIEHPGEDFPEVEIETDEKEK